MSQMGLVGLKPMYGRAVFLLEVLGQNSYFSSGF